MAWFNCAKSKKLLMTIKLIFYHRMGTLSILDDKDSNLTVTKRVEEHTPPTKWKI